MLKFSDEERKKKAGFGKAPIKKGTNYDTDNDGIDTEGKTLNKLQFFEITASFKMDKIIRNKALLHFSSCPSVHGYLQTVPSFPLGKLRCVHSGIMM